MLDQRANHAKASLERRSMLTFEHQTPCLSGGRRWREKTGVGFSVGQASANANERVTDGQQPEYLFATFYLRDNAHFSQQKESGRKSFGQKESMDSRKPVLTVLSLPVMRNLNGDPVGHARAELHVKLDPKHAQEGIALDRNWGVSFSVPSETRHNQFKTILETNARDGDFCVDLERINAQIQEILDLTFNAINLSVASAQASGSNVQAVTKDQLSTPSRIKQWKNALLDELQQVRGLLRYEVYGENDSSIESMLKKIMRLQKKRHEIVEVASKDPNIISISVNHFLLKNNLEPREYDVDSLVQLVSGESGSAELVCLEPLREAVREQGGQRIFIGIDTIMRALDPSNGGDAVYDGDFYACFPPAGDLQPASDPGEYLDFNVKAGLVGARTRVRRGEERWVILVIERNTLIGILASVEQYRNTDAIEEILRTIGEI